MRLKVLKADGSKEEYFHTKIIGAINNALSSVAQADITVAEELAEVVTYYLHQKKDSHTVSSNEIFSMVKVALTSTGYEEAAAALSEHHCERKIKRGRIEVISLDVTQHTDAELLAKADKPYHSSQWDKSNIVQTLVDGHKVNRQTARTIASMVEERILGMGITLVPLSLIKQLVIGETASVLRAL
jgi:anaerobic ribonucleoside-triphosphate reductase